MPTKSSNRGTLDEEIAGDPGVGLISKRTSSTISSNPLKSLLQWARQEWEERQLQERKPAVLRGQSLSLEHTATVWHGRATAVAALAEHSQFIETLLKDKRMLAPSPMGRATINKARKERVSKADHGGWSHDGESCGTTEPTGMNCWRKRETWSW